MGDATGSCVASAPVYIGGDSTDKKLTLTGQLDEVKLYPVALRPWQIHDLFTYQNGWVEDREATGIIVDNDSPVADVLLPLVTTYLPLRDAQIPITATDKTSGIASAVLCVDGTCGGAAPRCGESEAGLWCPTFHPGTARACTRSPRGHGPGQVDRRNVRCSDRAHRQHKTHGYVQHGRRPAS